MIIKNYRHLVGGEEILIIFRLVARRHKESSDIASSTNRRELAKMRDADDPQLYTLSLVGSTRLWLTRPGGGYDWRINVTMSWRQICEWSRDNQKRMVAAVPDFQHDSRWLKVTQVDSGGDSASFSRNPWCSNLGRSANFLSAFTTRNSWRHRSYHRER